MLNFMTCVIDFFKFLVLLEFLSVYFSHLGGKIVMSATVLL